MHLHGLPCCISALDICLFYRDFMIFFYCPRMVNTKSCPCGNTTDSNIEETTHPSYTDLSYVEMVVSVTVGAFAVLTFMLAVWLIVRR